MVKEEVKVRIAIPTHRRYHYLKLLVASLANSVKRCTERYPNVTFDVLIVASKLTDMPRLKESISPECLELRIVQSSTCSDVIQRNLAINSKSPADYIAFLDDDLVVDEGWAERVASHLARGDDIVQGNPIECANPEHILSAMESFAYGDMFNRYLEAKESSIFSKLVDPRNLLIKRGIVTEFSFDSGFSFGGSGFDLGVRLNNQGHRILFDPEMKIYHFNRENLFSLLAQKIMHGRGRRRLVLKYPQLRERYASPIYYLKRHYLDVYAKHGLSLLTLYLFFTNSAFWLGYLIEGISGTKNVYAMPLR